ncbi:MAG: hypothetical protein K1W35_04195 [Lachnospiraceae bacterium]
MNVQAVISNMKHVIPELRDTVTKDTPIYRVLKHADTHRRVIELALALGESRLYRHLKDLNLDKDFYFDNEYGYCIKCYTSVRRSDFFRDIYKELIGKEEYILEILAYDDIEVYIDLTHEELSGRYKYKLYIPQIKFQTPEKIVKISRGIVSCSGKNRMTSD